jgi:hypothetical protein
MTYQPEKLNLWDRLFNRYRKEVAERGLENWSKTYQDSFTGLPLESTRQTYCRDWVDYRIIDRLTGSVTIEREYLN